MVNADIVFRKLHNNEIDDVPIEEGNVIYDLDTKQIFVDDVVDGVLKRVKYGGSEKLIDAIISANTTTKTIYDDTITTDSIIRVYVDEDDSFTYNSISTASGSVTITFNAMTQDVPIKIGIGAVSEFHQLITEGQASDISYNNGQSGMTATDVQEAIDELKSDLGNIELTANNVEYDNVTSGLQATNVQDAVDEITDNLTVQDYTATETTLALAIDEYIAQANISDGETKRVNLIKSDIDWNMEITRIGSNYNGIVIKVSDLAQKYVFSKIGGASTVISPFSTTMIIPQLMASHAGAGKDGSLNCSINVTNFKTIKIGTMALNCPYGAIGNIGLSGNASGTLKSASNSTGVTYSNLTYNITNDTKLTFYGYSASVSGNNAYVKFANIELIP